MNISYYLNLRQQYHPRILQFIFILESPPISGLYFYDENGNISEPLFSEMMKLLNFKPQNKREGLLFFRNCGYLLVDATYRPVNNLKGKIRDEEILKNFKYLVEDLNDICNEIRIPIILVKANICRMLESKLKQEGFNIVNNGAIIPFPSTGQQKRFHQEISKIHQPA